MQHKWMVVLSAFILFSLLLVPAAPAHAQGVGQDPSPTCPPYDPIFLKDQGMLDSLPLECIKAYKAEARKVLPPAADVQVLTTGGPDYFGYIYNNSVGFKWINATTNSGLSGDDKASGPVNIGFPFPFYGVRHTQLYFNTNGLITFGAATMEWGAYPIPNDLNPNNYIAPFWDDLLVGSSFNNGGIYYSKGGSAPNRYFVIEWRDVENYDGVGTFSFEAILYEKGDIVILHKSLPSEYFTTVGIEDMSGDGGLLYRYSNGGLSAPKAIRFYYPTTSTARVRAYPGQQGGLVPLNGQKDFQIKVVNQGNLGTDRYDLTNSSAWPVSFYASNGTTPLSDTDGDTVIDTGPIPAGGSTTVIARYRVPAGAVVGDSNFEQIQLTSSRNTSVTAPVQLSMSVPAPFANVFVDDANSAMSFFTASAGGTKISKATPNNYFGYNLAMVPLTNGNYFYAWSRGSSSGGNWVSNIEYAILNRQGAVVRAPSKLTDNSGAALYPWDSWPAIAVAPNGTVGVVWRRSLYDEDTDKDNSNIFFATLNAAGARLTGPTNITNSTSWSYGLDFSSPNIAASSDNRFILGWEKFNPTNYTTNLWYAVRNTAGTQVFAPKALTSDGDSGSLVLNPLTGGKVIASWRRLSQEGPYYAVISSSGSISKPGTSFRVNTIFSSTDAVQLPNGNVAVAWNTNAGVQFAILNSSYALVSGPTEAVNSTHFYALGLSVTTDASSHVIMTWMDVGDQNKLLYALGDSSGAVLTEPMYYHRSGDYLDVSWRGQGNAPYQGAFVISGNAGVGGATLKYTGGTTKADSSGDYSFKVPFGWSGTVRPSKSGYIFSPVKKTYSKVIADQSAQDYTALRLYSISGNVGVPGATLTYTYGTARSVISQADGSYSFKVPQGWSGTVTPTHGCFTFDPVNHSYTDLSGNQTAQDYTPTVKPGCADITVEVGGLDQGRFGVPASGSLRTSFAGVDSGPVRIESTNVVPLMAAERVIYKVNGVPTSFSEMMALPNSQVDTIYWLPWYNNVGLDTQLRFANVSDSDTSVTVTIGGIDRETFTLPAGTSLRKSYPGIDSGPVKIVSDVNIVAAQRVIYKVNGVDTSFTEMMAMPNKLLEKTYWLPWYNNIDLDTQLRFANVSDTPATVSVSIGGVPAAGSPFTIPVGGSLRKSFPGINKGPVKIESDVNIVASERVIYNTEGGVGVSFSEMMAFPNNQLDTTYWLPWYNNKDLDTQLRFVNTSDTEADVRVTIGDDDMGTFALPAGASIRKSFPGIDKGPVKIETDGNIVVSERVIYNVNGVGTSFSELMALPNGWLDTNYWLPWYNNKGLDTQLRFGVP